MTARPLSPAEQQAVVAALSPDLRRVFFSQSQADQRHALAVAEAAGDGSDVSEAALLHDVGKVASDLGPYQRSIATLWSYTSLPVWGRWQSYLNHGEIGAELLEANGAADLTVAFARFHPGPAPEHIDASSWAALAAADNA